MVYSFEENKVDQVAVWCHWRSFTVLPKVEDQGPKVRFCTGKLHTHTSWSIRSLFEV